jgi:TRAP-type C4-dicarboxylate transport system permease small subunit
MKKLCDLLEHGLRVVLCALVAAMTLTVLWQVGTRMVSKFTPAGLLDLLYKAGLRFLAEPSQWTEELAGFLLGWVALLGAAYVYRKREHLGFDLLYSSFGPAAKRRLDFACYAMEALFALVGMGFGGFRLVLLTFQLGQTTAALHWPMGVIYLVIPLTGLLIFMFALDFTRTKLRGGEMKTAPGGDLA